MSEHVDFEAAFHAAELAMLAAAVRAVFTSARSASPDVVSLALRVRADDGQSVIEAEYLNGDGMAVAGFGV